MNSKYKGLCKGLAVTVLVLGIIGSIILVAVCGEVKNVSYSVYAGVSARAKRDAALTITYFVSGAFGSVILYAILAGLGEVLEYLELLSKKKTDVVGDITDSKGLNDEELPPL